LPTTPQLDAHLTAAANAHGYEVQICTGTGVWTTVKYSQQARTIQLTGLTTGTVYQVRARALGGSTGSSDWSMPGSSIVDCCVGANMVNAEIRNSDNSRLTGQRPERETVPASFVPDLRGGGG